MVVAQPANHGEGRSAEGAEGRTATEGDIARERKSERETEREGVRKWERRWVEELQRNRSATTRPLHKRYAACRRYADTFILTVMR